MTPEEKAISLRDKFIEATKVPNVKGIWVEDFYGAKQCALICVDEMLEVIDSKDFHTRGFYQDVKLELEKL